MAMVEIAEVLDQEIQRQIKEISKMQPGSKDHMEAQEMLTKLYKARVDHYKTELDYDEKCGRDEAEKAQNEKRLTLEERKLDIEQERLDHDKHELTVQTRDGWIGTAIHTALDIATAVLPLVFYGAWLQEGMKFEETGSFTSSTFRNFIGKLKPTKK